MQIVRVHLRNFGKIRDREFEFSPGCTAIMGLNGSGKSTVFGAIRFAFTGVNPNSGTKTDNICASADVTETSFVELVFVHAAMTWTVRRNLRPARPTAVLTSAAGASYEGDENVNRQIESILQTTMKALNDVVIVAQDEILGFLTMTPARRAELFQGLFNTQVATKIVKTLTEQARTVVVPTTGLQADEVQRQFAAETAKLQNLLKQREGFGTFVQMQQQRDEILRQLQQWQHRQQQQAELITVTGQIDGVTAVLQQQMADVPGRQAALTELRRQHLEKTRSAATYQQRLQALQHMLTIRQQWERQQQTMGAITQQLQALKTPTAPAVIESVDELEQLEKKLSVHLSTSRQRQQLFTTGASVCHTCGTTVATLPYTAESLQADVAEKEGFLNDVHHRIRRQKVYQQELQAYQQQHQSLTQQYQTLQTTIVAEPAKPQEVQREDWDTQTRQIERAIAAEEASNRKLETDIAAGQGRLQTLQHQRQSLLQTLQTLCPVATLEQWQALEQQAGALSTTIQQIQTLDTQIAAAQATLTGLQRSLQDIENVRQQAVIVTGWLEIVQAVISVMAKDGAPQVVTQRCLEMLQSYVNDVLELFQTNFRLHVGADLELQAVIDGSTRQATDRLSGGQKVVLALAFRLAMNLMLASSVGALYLDEPTAWLDDLRIESFRNVLQRLRELAASRGMQFIIVTHEQSLAPMFDSVVHL